MAKAESQTAMVVFYRVALEEHLNVFLFLVQKQNILPPLVNYLGLANRADKM